MNTTLVVKDWQSTPGMQRYTRAAAPGDNTPDNPKLTPHYIPAHRAHGWNGKDTDWNEPEAVMTPGNQILRPKRGKLNRLRKLDATTVNALAALDTKREALREEIKRLGQEEQALLAAAYAQGTPVLLAEVKAWKEAKRG